MLPIINCYTINDGSIDYNNQELFTMDLKPPTWVFLSSKPKALNHYAIVFQKLSFRFQSTDQL